MKETAQATPSLKCWTDYPFPELGDTPGVKAPIREARCIAYDGDKYATVMFENGTIADVKRGYLYTMPGRCGEVPTLDIPDDFASFPSECVSTNGPTKSPVTKKDE
jgi:hypothetical protein